MPRITGTVVRGLRCPIIKNGDDLENIILDTVLKSSEIEHFDIEEKDVLAITESIVARSQNNYVTVENISEDVKEKFGNEPLGVIFPILSRNRFAVCLKGIAKGSSKIVLMLKYPSDEVGNSLVSLEELDEKGINPWVDELNEKQFREHFGYKKHKFTGVDYVSYYKELIESCGAECEVIFSNNPKTILKYTKNVLTCDIHSRFRTKKLLKNSGAKKVFGLDEIMTQSRSKSGFNEEYGLLGSNKSTENSVKFFPRDCQPLVERIQKKIKAKTGKTIEVMIYGDGAFKDPVGEIWELADPVVSPGFTEGLKGTPNEVKIKYLADNNFSDLQGDALKEAISNHIKNKKKDLIGDMESQGTTPRRLTDLLGSLADLTSGSGDKGTPLVYIKGYFDNYSN